MADIVPLISSSTKGPLGVCHLPRLWLKMLLSAQGKLAGGYRAGSGGFDETTTDTLGIGKDEIKHYVDSIMPSYLEFEAWVKANAKHLDAGTIAKHNDYILNRDKAEEKAAEQREEIGAGAPETCNAVLLNDLDDWTAFHRHLVPERLKN
jgi:hypothetical protein